MIILRDHQYDEATRVLNDINENESTLRTRYDMMTLNKMLSSKLILAHRPHPTGGVEIIYAVSRTTKLSEVIFTITPTGFDFMHENE